jgi:hypothetical protein
VIRRILSTIIKNFAVICLYYSVAVVVVFTWQDLACFFAFGCKADDTSQSVYLVTGQMLVFMHLWMMFLFINAGFLKKSEIDSSCLIVPLITSTVLAALTWLAAHLIVMLLVFYLLWIEELWSREFWQVDLWLRSIF